MSALEDIKARAEGHTEGPLVVDDEEQTVRVGHAGEIMFDRSAESRSYWMECRPNAELIAAAPKLLAALEAVEALHPRELGGTPDGSLADICSECQSYYPCITMSAIAEALS